MSLRQLIPTRFCLEPLDFLDIQLRESEAAAKASLDGNTIFYIEKNKC